MHGSGRATAALLGCDAQIWNRAAVLIDLERVDVERRLPGRKSETRFMADPLVAWRGRATSRDENARAFSPNFVELTQKATVVCNLPELLFVLFVFL